MKKVLVAVGLLLVVAAAAAAQGPFADVPPDHWAYEAVNSLQEKGIIQGYPDGTFGGKRAITRYEFAVAIARAIPVIIGMVPQAQKADLSDLEKRIKALEEAKPTPTQPPVDTSQMATKADLENVRRLMDQFRDELAALGVDVDALKRDMAALTERVVAVEKEQDRVKWNGNFDVFGVATDVSKGTPIDRDNRGFGTADNGDLLGNVGAIYDADLNIRGRISEMASAMATINFGNYLSYIGNVDDFVGSVRPASGTMGLSDGFFPYYLGVDAAFGSGSIQVGRIPLQLTSYTLKKIDVDSYTSIMKTDDGNYPVDGAKIDWRIGGVGVTAFAAKHNQNSVLANGLTSQANGGPYSVDGQFNDVGGAAAGGLGSIDQSAGARVTIGTPYKGNLGLTYIRAAGPATAVGGTTYDQVDIFGGDLNFNYGKYSLGLEYAQTITKKAAGQHGDVDKDNQAFDGKIGATFGGLGLNVGYRMVEKNFTAPGSWERIGRWANPTNIQGPYLDATYGITESLKLNLGGAFYQGAKNLSALADAIDDENDDLWRANLGLKWGVSQNWSVDAGAEFIRWSPSGAGNGDTDEAYYTIGAAWQINPNAGLRLAYQIADYNPETGGPYGTTDYKGNIAVAEFGVKF